MTNSVVIKGIQSGIIIVLDGEMPYEELRNDIIEKFKSSKCFLGKADIAVSFEGRDLSNEQLRDIVEIIHTNTDLNIVCVLSDDPIREARFQKSIEDKLLELSQNTGIFHKGSIRNGQTMDVETGVIILGDVCEGGCVNSKGNVIVLGSISGSVCAGINGNSRAFVVAMNMKSTSIKIAEYTYYSGNTKNHKLSLSKKRPEIAYVTNGKIYIEEITKESIHEIRIQ